MKIGGFEPRNPYFLAPMAGITDWPFRLLCVEQGAGLVYTEMVNVRALHHQDAETLRIAQTHEKERPCAVQIFGHEPELMAEAVRYFLKREDIGLIDINMGCPTPKIVKNGDGSALMATPELAERILKAAVQAAEGRKPVTVKFRKGWTSDDQNFLDFGRRAEAAGVSAVTLHGRTREQFYSGMADWESIGLLKSELSIPVIGNGDVRSLDDADRMMQQTGCDAVMIGRGAQGNPWVFQREADERKTDERKMDQRNTDERNTDVSVKHSDMLDVTSMDERWNGQAGYLHVLVATILRHYSLLAQYKGEMTAHLEMRKHIAWYLRGVNGAAAIRASVYQAENFQIVAEILEHMKMHRTCNLPVTDKTTNMG